MESLINVQQDLRNSMERSITNYKKSPKERLTREYVETRMENLERDWLLFRKNNTKLYEISVSIELANSLYVKNEMYDKMEDLYIDTKSHMKALLNRLTIDESTPKNEAGCSFTPSVKLPKITIPIFSGKYQEWTTFRDLFISLIHKNQALANVQKLHYLKGHLTGEAEQLIRHIPITDCNYAQCWSQLENRYDNKKYLANCILKRLFGIKKMNIESASGLKDLVDTTTDCLSALSNLGVNVSTWDIIVIHIVTYKLDPETRKQWEITISSESHAELPTLVQFTNFIESRFRALECLEPKAAVVQYNNGSPTQRPRVLFATNKSNFGSNIRCEYCAETHKLCFCKKFAQQDYAQRHDFVMSNNICFNCLGGNHPVRQCQNPTNCRVCNKRHHSLLHPQANASGQDQNNQERPLAIEDGSGAGEAGNVVTCLSTNKVTKPGQVLLATALIKAQSGAGGHQVVRALLDQGSQASFVTEATVQYLRLKKLPVKGTITGLSGDGPIISRSMVTLIIFSLTDPNVKIEVKAYVLKGITSYLPEKKTEAIKWEDLKILSLADPQFNSPNKIDILLGADVYSQVLKEGVKRSPTGTMIAQCTTLGWIVSGVVDSISSNSTNYNSEQIRNNSSNNSTKNSSNDSSNERPSKITVMHAQINETELLKRFWELEDQIPNSRKIFTEEEERCEKLFSATTQRTKDGRYVVRLPFRDDEPLCKGGNSREIAVRRLKGLERRFSKDQTLKEKYTEVLNEYLLLGHMKPISECKNKIQEAVYLPHHAVVREDKSTTKVRVVFDGSCKNENGVSLNDTLMIGPTLQADLRHTVMRWRAHPIGLVADIVKMYRQVRVAEEDTGFQRIIWRDDPKMEIKDYELVTVTFGTAAAPYLAVRTLHQVAKDEGQQYPLAKEKVLKAFYMDDLMTGCFTVNEGKELYKQISKLLEKGGFKLQKWNSNNKELLYEIAKDQREKEGNKEKAKGEVNNDNKPNDTEDSRIGEERGIKLDSTIKILGLTWNRLNDDFRYSVQLPPKSEPETKRSIIADIARLFDPLGWIAPSVIIAKMFIQKLWLAGIGWDEEISRELIQEWQTYRSELHQLTTVRIPRWLQMTKGDARVELHGFSDASKLAYAAVVYVRAVDNAGNVHVSLLAAKTKVAPIKQISIPRLELCGAVLLTKLLAEVAEVMEVNKENVRAWTDSTVVLAWLNSHPSKWKTFVGNRVSEILTTLDSAQWAHVTSKDNPADYASRGVRPAELPGTNLWFFGPMFLREHNITYEKPQIPDVSLEESVKSHFTEVKESPWNRFSTLKKLVRVIAYCRRFLDFKRNIKRTKNLMKTEIDDALQCCIKECQKEEFIEEYGQLQREGWVKSKRSKIRSLCPLIDDKGIIRVGGRLQGSQLAQQVKHPIVLPHSSYLTKLIVIDAHEKTLHGGPQLMMNFLRTAYWIIGVKSLVKQHVRRCVTCVRFNANVKNQLMGSLPSARCTPTRAFLHSGVDYAGPINIRTTKGRGHRAYKGYICLFICMATRAIHLELVSDMTTSGFLAAFRRFVSRRGHCAQLWSDNGTNFVGAARELQHVYSLQRSFAENLVSNGTEWHFIPPHAPNFGGLWEAGVKSTKFHLKRVIGETTLTYEELNTLLNQIEACLNSRPMSIVNDSNDPNEPVPLTPGHFLVGEPLIIVPDANYEISNISSLTRWQNVQRMVQHFWRRWAQEYLASLLHRYKWSDMVPEPNVGDIVLIKEDDLPPSRWLLGRVVQKHPGHDNLTRVVTLRTKTSTIKRPTSKLCVLPVTD